MVRSPGRNGSAPGGRVIRLRSESVPGGAEFTLARPEDLSKRNRVRLHLAAKRMEKVFGREIPWLDRQVEWLLPLALPDANEFVLASMSKEQRVQVVYEFLYREA